MDINANHPLAKLSNAIVLQSVTDYVDALVEKHEAEEMLYNAEKMIDDVESFYKSDWYTALTDVPPETLFKVIRTQADYIIWQKARGCRKCKFKDCPHKIKKANWLAWSRGENACPKYEQRKDFYKK